MRFPRKFGMRWLLLSLLSLLVLVISMSLFESASGPDFEPLQDGGLFNAYHTILAIIMSIVLWPAALPELLRAKFGVTVPFSDPVEIFLAALVDGLAFTCLWQSFSWLRPRRHTQSDATPTI